MNGYRLMFVNGRMVVFSGRHDLLNGYDDAELADVAGELAEKNGGKLSGEIKVSKVAADAAE